MEFDLAWGAATVPETRWPVRTRGKAVTRPARAGHRAVQRRPAVDAQTRRWVLGGVKDSGGGEFNGAVGITDQMGGVSDEIIKMLGHELCELTTGGWDVGCSVDHDSTRGWLAATVTAAYTRLRVWSRCRVGIFTSIGRQRQQLATPHQPRRDKSGGGPGGRGQADDGNADFRRVGAPLWAPQPCFHRRQGAGPSRQNRWHARFPCRGVETAGGVAAPGEVGGEARDRLRPPGAGGGSHTGAQD